VKRLFLFFLLTLAGFIVILTCIVSCANMGAGPDGGPYDETPPRIVGMTAPSQVASGATTKGKKHKRTKFQMMFSELVQLENANENVIVSPPQLEQPNIVVSGKKITVELLDSLKPNTTYTVDFADAIKDNNEGNPLGHFTYIFSTGEKTDTMEMSGYVLNAEDLEPMAGVLVGLYPIDENILSGKEKVEDDSVTIPNAPKNDLEDLITGPAEQWLVDTLFTTTPFDRVARTDASGYFSIKGVAEGKKYHIYALKDGDADFHFSQKSEAIAFSKDILTPSAFGDTRYDTLWVDSTRYDSIRVIPFTHYLPDDIVLLAFQEANQPRTLLKAERNDFENFKTYFTAPSEQIPTIEPLNFDATDAFIEQRNVGNDTIIYWLKDSLLMKQDTLDFVYHFMAWNDSLQQHVSTTDTLSLTSRVSWQKRLDQKRKDDEKWEKQVEKRHKKGDFAHDERPIEYIKMTASVNNTLAPNENITLTFAEPIDSIDLSMVHLELIVDSTATESDFLLDTVPNNILARRIYAEWRPEQKYCLTIDSAAIHNIYGLCNSEFKKEFSIESLENYGTLFITLNGLEKAYAPFVDRNNSSDPYDHALVQLLDRSGKPMYSVYAKDHRAEFYYLRAGEYYLRCIVDRNENGKWDPGAWENRMPAEDVFYSDQTYNVRAGWDDNQEWDVSAIARNLQKPSSLVKQKKTSKSKSSAHERNIKRLEDRAKGASGQTSSSSKNSLGKMF